MATKQTAPVSHWVTLLQSGQVAAAQPLWERYYSQLVKVAHGRFCRTGGDHEVVAASAFNSFCAAALKGRFPDLKDRHDLWKLLVFITGQKVINYHRRQQANKRGGKTKIEGMDALEHVISREPTPEFAVMVAEEFQRLLDRLGNQTLQKIALAKLEGFTNEEIAKQLGCSVRTVAYKLDFIRAVLREGKAT